MRKMPFITVLTASVLALALTVSGETLPRKAQLLGVARSNGVETSFDKRLQGELDRLIPQLKNLDSDATILIEAFYPETKAKGRAHQVNSAYSLAEQVHNYLKKNHALDRDFFVAIWDDPEAASNYPKIRITTYPRNYFEN